jgi:hypothetical protein
MGLTEHLCAGPYLVEHEGHILAAVYAWIPLSSIICTVLLAAVSLLLEHLPFTRGAYKSLSQAQRLATCLHCAYALAYAGMVVPMTIYTSQLVFGDMVERTQSGAYTAAFILFNINLSLYIAEALARAVLKRQVGRQLSCAVLCCMPPGPAPPAAELLHHKFAMECTPPPAQAAAEPTQQRA